MLLLRIFRAYIQGVKSENHSFLKIVILSSTILQKCNTKNFFKVHFHLITFDLGYPVKPRRWISGTESAHLAAIDSNLIFIQGWWWCLTRIGDSKGLFNYSEFMIISCSWSWMIISTSIILFVIAEWSRQMIWLGLLL